MAPKRSTKRQKTTGNALDMSNYLNWPASTLREKLTEANINASPSFPLSVLRKLYADNIIESNADSSSSSLNQQISVQDTENVPSNSVISSESINSNNLATSSDAPSRATSPSTTCLNTTGSESPIVVQSLMNTVQSLQTMVSSLATMVSAKESNPTAQYSLQNYYQSTETTCSPSTSRKFGTNPEDLPQIDLISPSLRKNIVEGKDVNLASLLIPYFEVRPSEKEKEKDDYRLKRNLTISEFLTSFGKYKRVMSHAFPNRREELDMYEANIIDIFNVYGDRFYEYHKLFSLKSASALAIHKIKVDWSARDRDLIQLIASRARSCSICSEVSHDTKFCPSFQKSEVTPFNNTDRHGRKRTSFNGQEICNNFNSSRRCNRSNCPYQHNKSAVDELLSSEIKKGFLSGPYQTAPFQQYRVSPLGIAERKYSKKKRLIVDLSAPHNNDAHPSINDLIDKDECSLSYVSIDDAIKCIKKFGKDALMCKTDISDAFKLIPILPSQYHLSCVKWRNQYYFYTRLAFGCRSSPKIFDQFSQAICWIAENNYGIECILHLLDDFLTIDRPDFPADRTMAVLTMLFNKLNVPLAKNTRIEFLGPPPVKLSSIESIDQG
uniref:C3H1-type domain-containing protein n=1 Tax=Magallana gigas TaxID=29159 RepID=A0A8W8L8Q0_MAGGI